MSQDVPEFDALGARYGVSRETLQRLDLYADELARWSKRINLIGPGTAQDIWSRHILDSLQLLVMAPDWTKWVDFGSGAGLPGMVMAAVAQDDPARQVTMIESNRKKTAFLRAVAPRVAPRAVVVDERIEVFAKTQPAPDIVSARAVADLDQLFEWLAPWAGTKMTCIFPKGRGYEKELEDSRRRWRYDCQVHESVVDPSSVVLEIRNFRPA